MPTNFIATLTALHCVCTSLVESADLCRHEEERRVQLGAVREAGSPRDSTCLLIHCLLNGLLLNVKLLEGMSQKGFAQVI